MVHFALEPTAHVHHVRKSSILEDLSSHQRAPCMLAPADQPGIFGEILFDDLNKVRVWPHSVDKWNILRPGNMACVEFLHGAHVQIDVPVSGIKQTLGFLGSNSFYVHLDGRAGIRSRLTRDNTALLALPRFRWSLTDTNQTIRQLRS